jgi:uncharacterized protein YcnI
MKLRRMSALALVGALVVPALASAHARVSPAVSLSKKLQLYSLAVPTEKEKLTTSKIVMNVPAGFGIDSFAPAPGWKMDSKQTGTGNNAVITQVTWTGGKTPTGEDSVFSFLAQPDSSKTYKFTVEQTYSDGSIVNWSEAESSDHPAPTIESKSSLGGGSSGASAVSWIALVLAAVALAAGGLALAGARSGKGRSLT